MNSIKEIQPSPVSGVSLRSRGGAVIEFRRSTPINPITNFWFVIPYSHMDTLHLSLDNDALNTRMGFLFSKLSYNPDRDIPDLRGKVAVVTGAKCVLVQFMRRFERALKARP